jgi:dihydroorotate dehydrogenase (NAD+) catalytic subunit
MAVPDISVELLGIPLDSPLLLASGILGETGPSLLEVLESGAAGVVTKSIGPDPRDGHPNPTVVELDGSMMNAMGLPNPGASAFTEELEWLRGRTDRPVIASVFGSTPEEYAHVASVLSALSDAIELNLSCPHARGYGAEIGSDPGMVEEVVGAVVDRVDVPVLAKLTPNTSDVVALARAAVGGGASGLVAVNTLKGMVVDVDMGAPALANTYGGLSGEALRAVGVRCVHEIASSLDVPVVGVGGVATARDALEYLMAGATAVQVGTAIRSAGPSVFERISGDMREWLEVRGHRSLADVQGILVGGDRR